MVLWSMPCRRAYTRAGKFMSVPWDSSHKHLDLNSNSKHAGLGLELGLESCPVKLGLDSRNARLGLDSDSTTRGLVASLAAWLKTTKPALKTQCRFCDFFSMWSSMCIAIRPEICTLNVHFLTSGA